MCLLLHLIIIHIHHYQPDSSSHMLDDMQLHAWALMLTGKCAEAPGLFARLPVPRQS